MSLADRRVDYGKASFDAATAAPDPISQFRHWYAEAEAARLVEPNAMTLATAGIDGAPTARIVLLKEVDERGFVFFTDYRSQKGGELRANPRAALVFFWQTLERQVRIVGKVERVSAEESAAYYASRPRESQLGAWASHQSQPLRERAVLDRSLAEVASRFGDGQIPYPVHWGGFRVIPDAVEFWQGRPSRLHDRLLYGHGPAGWVITRLSP